MVSHFRSKLTKLGETQAYECVVTPPQPLNSTFNVKKHNDRIINKIFSLKDNVKNYEQKAVLLVVLFLDPLICLSNHSVHNK